MTKVGFLSDIHGNIAALQAVLSKLDDEACDLVICLGDLVGYGPNPTECVQAIRAREIPTVLGNHDQYVTMLLNPRMEKLREDVRISVEWTQSQLPMDDLKWLAQLPLRLDAEDFSVVHGAFGPKPWVYCASEKALAHNFAHQDVALGFCGHSHVPIIALDRGEAPPALDYLHTMPLPTAPKVMINIGSVGQPRDRDPRASCVVYELESRHVALFRVPYDIEDTQARIRAAGLPEAFATRLAEGR
ncbi:MAG: metallophosphoesterase family protein [Lentisphaerae bacterium]|nr:metallophosphoesterase family protein [Lentisphaerota bacterium]